MPERRERGQPTTRPDRHTPDLAPGYIEPERPAFGTHRVCSSCKGKTTKKGETCRTCGGSGYEKIVPMRRAPSSTD